MYTQRLKIPYDIYIKNPTKAVKELLGQHISILSLTENDIILPDGNIPVDITYSNIYININPDEIHYIPSKDLKQLYPDSEYYVATINDNPVKIKLTKKSDTTSTYIPMYVKLMLPSQDNTELQFSYYGMVVTQPLQQLASPLKYINHQYNLFNYPAPLKRYTDEYKRDIDKLMKQQDTHPHDKAFPPLQSIAQTILEYKKAISTFKILKYVNNITFAKTYKEALDPSTAYVLHYSQIPRNTNINGIIIIISKRTPFYILYHPTLSFQMLKQEVDSIIEFIENDYLNFLNYHYLMK